MVKQADQTLHMKVRQFLVTGRRLPSEKNPDPSVYALRVFAPNEVIARSKFWIQMRLINSLKKVNGETLNVTEIHEKNTSAVKIYGIVIRYQSRTGIHNSYKEYRDITLNGAIGQLYQNMAGSHRARAQQIRILRTGIVTKKEDVKRVTTIQLRNGKIKFPITKTLVRPTHKKFRKTFSATRPSTFKS